MKRTTILILLASLISLSVFVSAYQLSGEEDIVTFEKYVDEGWNLLGGGVFASMPASDSDIKKEDISAIYFLMYPGTSGEAEFQAFASQVTDPAGELGSAAAWVYVKKSSSLKYTTDDFRKVDDRQLRQGWNFVSIDNSFGGKSVAQIKGNCEITKYARWADNPTTPSNAKEWIVLSSQNEINQIQYSAGGSYVGEGNLFYVTSNCELGSSTGGIGNPPEFP